MSLFPIALGIILSFFSVAILSYVSIATMMGPWIAPTLVIIASLCLKLRIKSYTYDETVKNLLLIQAIGAGGGVIAVAFGFSLPILFFLDAAAFQQLLSSGESFCLLMGLICFAAGSLGIVFGQLFAGKMLNNAQLPFPTCKMIYELAALPSKKRQIKQLFLGGGLTFLVSALRDGFCGIAGFIPKVISLFNHQLLISVWPTMWVIGFTSGAAIMQPLVIGLITQKIVHVIFKAGYFGAGFALDSFFAAFCGGIVLCDIAYGLFDLIKKSFKAKNTSLLTIKNLMVGAKEKLDFYYFLSLMVALSLSCSLFYYYEIPLVAQLLYICLIMAATYEICFFGCNIGLVPFGRFSTLILIPLLLLFKLSYFQITFLCIFFTVCAASASDIIFDKKIGLLGGLSSRYLVLAQWVGLCAASLSIGIILYLLITHFSLGTPEFFGQRGQSKALMIKSLSFNPYIVCMGFIYAAVLKRFRIAPMMTFGGIIMPSNITTGLILGSFLTRFIKAEKFIAFCSGVLVSEVLWIMLSILFKLVF